METRTAVGPSVAAAIDHLDLYGYCVLEGLMPPEVADHLAARYLGLHADPANQRFITGDQHYQTLFGLMNLDELCWQYSVHADVLAIARHFLGPKCILGESTSKPCWPGAPIQTIHADSVRDFERIPDVPWLINTMWMLTDFTRENGATVVVPFSHKSRRRPPGRMSVDDPLLRPQAGRRGSILLWDGRIWHGAGANVADEVRVGLHVAYYAPWFNYTRMPGHQPIWPETIERMPEELREMCRWRVGRERSEVYQAV